MLTTRILSHSTQGLEASSRLGILSTQTPNLQSANPITATAWNLFQSSLSNPRRYVLLGTDKNQVQANKE
jgi:hypothetical protein